MERLKSNIEELNNLYYKLFGMYDGVIEVLDGSKQKSEEIRFLKENLNMDYLNSYLEDVDEYVISIISHSLDCDSYLYTEEKNKFTQANKEDIYDMSTSFYIQFLKDLKKIETEVANTEINISGFGLLCEEMRGIADQINESLFIISRDVMDFVHNGESSISYEMESL